jgi:hypothetical protein
LTRCAAHKVPLQKAKEIMAKTEMSKHGFNDVTNVFGEFFTPRRNRYCVARSMRVRANVLLPYRRERRSVANGAFDHVGVDLDAAKRLNSFSG